MTNAIGTNYLMQYQSAGLGKQPATSTGTELNAQNPLAEYGADTKVEISDAGRNALQASKGDESQLSAKAQSYLESLRKKYGDYDFVVSNNLDAAQTVGSDKEYSVIFTVDELEKMAEDDDYAQKVMGQVGDAVDMMKGLWEKDLGEGVQFSQLSVTFDSEGNMKLFAQLEKLSAEQKERLEAAAEKRAEEQAKDDGMPVVFKSADVEAENAEELLNKIFGIDWSKIPDEEARI